MESTPKRFDGEAERFAAEAEPELAGSWQLERAPQTVWYDHIGLLVFGVVLEAVAQVVDPPQGLFKQWLSSLLSGALNIEQTKFLNWPDLSGLVGEVVRFPHAQRQELERVIEEKMVRLDPEKKRLMDSLRVIARNVFYQALQPFKKAYNNYRDDHAQFRQLTQASGVLEVRPDQIVVLRLAQRSEMKLSIEPSD